MFRSNPRKVMSLKVSIQLTLEKAQSSLAATKAWPCLLLAQVKLFPLKPRSLRPEAKTISLKSLTEGEEGGQMLSFSLTRRIALKSPITHHGKVMLKGLV